MLSTPKLVCAGVLPFFDRNNMILLGSEYRKRQDSCFWMEFGGKQEKGETLAETAWREANEETADLLQITLEQVLAAERKGYYIDHYNEKTDTFYRMYCIQLSIAPPAPEAFTAAAVGKSNVEKTEWRYFSSQSVIYNFGGVLPGTEITLYDTMCARLEKLKREATFLNCFLPLPGPRTEIKKCTAYSCRDDTGPVCIYGEPDTKVPKEFITSDKEELSILGLDLDLSFDSFVVPQDDVQTQSSVTVSVPCCSQVLESRHSKGVPDALEGTAGPKPEDTFTS